MRAFFDRLMAKLGYSPTSETVAHYGPHQRHDIHRIDCRTAQMLLDGQLHRGQFADPVWRDSIVMAAGRKLPKIYDLLAEVYRDDTTMSHRIMEARMTLPTIYWDSKDTPKVQIGEGIEISFTTAVSNDNGTLSHMPDLVTVTRTDTGKSITFMVGCPANFTFVMDDVPKKLRELLIPANV